MLTVAKLEKQSNSVDSVAGIGEIFVIVPEGSKLYFPAELLFCSGYLR